MNYNDFASRLSRLEDDRLPHVFLLCSAETYFIDKAEELLLARLLPSAQERADGLVQLEGARDARELEQEISAVPFFGDRVVVLVKQSKIFGDKKKPGSEDEGDGKEKEPVRPDKGLDSLLAAIADMPETNYVIFRHNWIPDKRRKAYKAIANVGMVMDAEPLRPWEAAGWLAADLRRRGFRLEPAAYEYLTEMLSALRDVPLGYLSGELDKLELFLAARGVRPASRRLTSVSLDQVKASFSMLPEISGFAITTALEEGRGADALRLFAEELQGGAYLPAIVGMLAYRVREYLTAKALLKRGLDGRALSQALGQNKFYPHIINRLIQMANSREESLLRRVFLDLADADYRLKTGQGGPELLEAAIIALAKGGTAKRNREEYRQ